jgi:Ca2+-binding RTX toxin-like protein
MAIIFSSDGLSITGDNENDRILSNSPVEFVDGGGGNDEITYRNILVKGDVRGGPGDDLLSGFPAVYNGGADDDRISISRGSDAIGGQGKDTISYTLSSILPGQKRDMLSGGKDFDILKVGIGLDFLNSGYKQLLVDQAQGRITATDAMGQSTVLANLSGFENVTASGQAGAVIKLRGDAGPNQIIGSIHDDTIFGGGDFDLLLGGDGRDLINGGNGKDFIVDAGLDYSNSSGFVTAGFDTSSPDTLKGGAGDDTIVAIGGRDDVAGNAGDDVIHVNGQATRVKGGADNDFVYFSEAFAVKIAGISAKTGDPDWLKGADLDGGKGRDELNFRSVDFKDSALSDVTIDLENGVGEYRASSNLFEPFKVTNFEILVGSTRDDTFQGTAKNETFSRNGDRDFIAGGGGNDTIDGGSGNDRLKGDGGRDTILGGKGRDWIDGGRDTDVIDRKINPPRTPSNPESMAGWISSSASMRPAPQRMTRSTFATGAN